MAERTFRRRCQLHAVIACGILLLLSGCLYGAERRHGRLKDLTPSAGVDSTAPQDREPLDPERFPAPDFTPRELVPTGPWEWVTRMDSNPVLNRLPTLDRQSGAWLRQYTTSPTDGGEARPVWVMRREADWGAFGMITRAASFLTLGLLPGFNSTEFAYTFSLRRPDGTVERRDFRTGVSIFYGLWGVFVPRGENFVHAPLPTNVDRPTEFDRAQANIFLHFLDSLGDEDQDEDDDRATGESES